MPMKLSEFKSGVIGKIKEKFKVVERPGRHIYYEIWYKGKKIKETYHSHGSSGKEISDDILQKIKRQLNLNNIKQLYELKNCPMTAENYFNLLKQKNVISD
jgi:benzoyl-CoA reductase/2-hydroxyglutaryl-CoA dehydratase subunit BcrC/BadD/HgdB